ncbi:MAG TPA: transglutaminaseTgpA domain-containing protein [Acidimicrobiales bacterium]|nr:transglutaminaseTgpA domain-containing protein [Acidimicrobiales bacterium]
MTAATTPAATGIGARIRQANARMAAEDSIALRVAVAIAGVAAATAALRQGVGGGGLRLAVIVGLPAAHAISYLTRKAEGMWLKGGLAVGILIAFGVFLEAVSGIRPGVVTDVQIPLAELFLWTQLLHSLDLPSRRDLLFSLMSSLVLLAVAGVLSISMSFALHLVVWAVAGITGLVLAHQREVAVIPDRLPTTGGPDPAVRAARPIAAVLALVTVLGAFAFMLVPPAGTVRALTFPAALPSPVRVPSEGGLSNPTLGDEDPARQSDPGRPNSGKASFGYTGFSQRMDTSVRGRPDETLVMRVRASKPDFWKGQTFDTWDGRQWTLSDERFRPVRTEQPLRIPTTMGEVDGSWDELVQTFYFQRPGPNLVFAANHPRKLYFPDNAVFQLSDGTLRAGVELEEKAVYTVVSALPHATPDSLRASEPFRSTTPPGLLERYTKLDRVPERVAALARDITAGAPTAYDKVRAIEGWMAANTRYTLDIPVLPKGADAVEQFLFVDRQGFCEQIGTSLVVMLRSLGIPARLAVGYAAGERNPFTGLFEVRASDAHAWAEVWFPDVGWQGFDPTAHVPLAGLSGPRSAGAGAVSYISTHWPGVPAGLPRILFGIVGAAAVVWSVLTLVTWDRARRRRPVVSWPVAYLDRVEAEGAARGRPRRPSQTPSEYLGLLQRSVLPDPRWGRVVETVDAAAYAGAEPTEDERAHAEEVLREAAARWPAASGRR